MIVLDSLSRKLEIDLAGAITTNQAQTTVCYYDENLAGEETKSATQVSASNSTTDATICAAPTKQGFIRYIEAIFIYNADTVSIDATIKIDDSGTETQIIRQTIPTLRTLCYEHGNGWYSV